MVHTKADSGGFHAQTGKYGSLHSILALSKSLLFLVSPFLVKKNKETGNSKKSYIKKLYRGSRTQQPIRVAFLFQESWKKRKAGEPGSGNGTSMEPQGEKRRVWHPPIHPRGDFDTGVEE